MKSLIIKTLAVFLIASSVTSCQTIDIRGQYVDDASITQLQNKTLTKAEVVDLIGTPTIVPDYNPNTWYYIQRSLARRAWFDPKVIEQRIVEVKFDSKDVVNEVIVSHNSHVEEVKNSNDYTQTYGTEANGIQKFVRNIGRFNKTTDGKKRNKKK